jgi:glutathione S-transferase
MKLFFAPLACSLATRITLYEAGAQAEYVQVDTKAQKTADGRNFRALSELGLVPLLELDDGELLSENAAILQYVGGRFPDTELSPSDGRARMRLQQWLSFIGTELHKLVYGPLLDKSAPEAVKAYALDKADVRLSWLAAQLEERETLLDRFSVADAYLFTVLNWSLVTPIDLQKWPPLTIYLARIHARPAVARAFDEERALYLREIELGRG